MTSFFDENGSKYSQISIIQTRLLVLTNNFFLWWKRKQVQSNLDYPKLDYPDLDYPDF